MRLGNVILRAMLLVVAATGLFSGVAVFIPWRSSVTMLERLGIEGVPPVLQSPIIEYWILMMAAAAFVFGYLYLAAAISTQKYKPLFPILGWGLVLIGVTAAYHGFRLGLPPWPFYADVAICAACGPGIVWLARRI